MTHTLTAKLVVADADAAIAYYRDAFDAVLLQRYTAGDSVVFAQLELFGTTISVKDADAADPAPTPSCPGTILELATDDPDAVAARMLDAGGTVIFPVADQHYGARGGRIRDPFGHQWLLQTPITDPPEQVQAALDGDLR